MSQVGSTYTVSASTDLSFKDAAVTSRYSVTASAADGERRMTPAFIARPSSNGLWAGPVFGHAYGLMYVLGVSAAIFVTF